MPRPAKGARLWYDKTSGLWYIRDGSAKRGTGCGLEERARAEEALREYIGQKYEPPRDSSPSRLLVSDVLTFYAREIAPGQKSDATSYAIERLLDWWKTKPLSEVKRSTCQDYVAYRTSQPIRQAKKAKEPKLVSAETARRELTVLRAAINAYHAETPLDALPVVTLPQASEARPDWLRRDQVAKLLRATRKFDDKDAARALQRFILLGVYTGTRSGALRRLGWIPNTLGGHIDVDAGVIHRRGDDEAETKKRRPTVRIPQRLSGFLTRWRQADMKREKPIAYVIHYRGSPVDKQRKAWASARQAAGLGKEITPHILRHTAASWLMLAGAEIWDVANYLGMSPKMLEDVYGHHHPDFQKEVASKVGKRR
ncbi:tyrosine-type recombinase/integrase [Shinella sp. BYT-45]|uniref:tyrosine-type recombinase/integrase n=1 Tax=Shinella sp. BYT-45 TaxID=3377377 RepID=UPI00397FED10